MVRRLTADRFNTRADSIVNPAPYAAGTGLSAACAIRCRNVRLRCSRKIVNRRQYVGTFSDKAAAPRLHDIADVPEFLTVHIIGENKGFGGRLRFKYRRRARF